MGHRLQCPSRLSSGSPRLDWKQKGEWAAELLPALLSQRGPFWEECWPLGREGALGMGVECVQGVIPWHWGSLPTAPAMSWVLSCTKSLQALWHWKEAQQPHSLWGSGFHLRGVGLVYRHSESSCLWAAEMVLGSSPGLPACPGMCSCRNPPPSCPPFQNQRSSHCQQTLAEEPT